MKEKERANFLGEKIPEMTEGRERGFHLEQFLSPKVKRSSFDT